MNFHRMPSRSYSCRGKKKREAQAACWRWKNVCVCMFVNATIVRKNHLLFHLEYVLIEMLLQRFVRVIDTKLFERVDLECLETENVKDADVRGRIFLSPDPRRSILLLGAYA